MSHIYTECGALERLFLFRSFHNLHVDKRNGLTLSFYPLNHLRGWGEEFDVNEKDSIISIGNLSDIRLL